MKGILQCASALVFCASFPAHSVIVHLAGATVDFYYDDSQLGGFALFGELGVVGDSIFAQPTVFRADALNGNDETISALGTVQVVAKSGYNFDSVLVAQQGDYAMSGAGSTVSVTADLTVDSNSSAAGTTEALINSGLGMNDGSTHAWSSSVTVDLSTPMWASVTDIDLTLESILAASTVDNGELAWIENKFVGGGLVTVMTTPPLPGVPLPASLWLLVSGLVGLAGFARKKGRLPVAGR